MHIVYLFTILGLMTQYAIGQTFEEVGLSLGVTATYDNPGQFGGGCAIEDINGDGLMDILAASGTGHPLMIYLRTGNEYTLDAGLGCGITSAAQTSQILFGDYDNDGHRDVFVGNWGSENLLFRSNGNGTYSDVTSFTGVDGGSAQTSAACWLDYNNDGWLDLYVTNYDISSAGRPDYRNVLYRNNEGVNFTDVTEQAGVADSADRAPLAVISFDFDNDLDADIYIANDRNQRGTLFRNNGDGTFSDAGDETGIEPRMFGMGCAISDLNHDGWWDLYVTNDPIGNLLFESNGDGTWEEVASQRGVTVNYGCWGTEFLDFDMDGDDDLYVANMAPPMPRDYLFENTGNGYFTDVSVAEGVNDQEMTFGFAKGDLDNDGDMDMLASNIEDRPYVYLNRSSGFNYIRVRTQGVQTNRDGVGAKVVVYAGSLVMQQFVCAGQSYASSSDPRLLFSLGTQNYADSIVVLWPSGVRDTWRNLDGNRDYVLEEGVSLDVPTLPPLTISFELRQNYPNPFNPVSTIEFQLNTPSEVELSVYNPLGQRVATLVDEPMSAGLHRVQFDGAELTSGSYVYRLTANGHSQNRVMTLLK